MDENGSRGDKRDLKKLDLTNAGQLVEFLLGKRGKHGERYIGERHFLSNFPAIFQGGEWQKDLRKKVEAGKPEICKEIVELYSERDSLKNDAEMWLGLELDGHKVEEFPKVTDDFYKGKGYEGAEHFYDFLASKYEAKIVLLSAEAADHLINVEGVDVKKLDILPEIKEEERTRQAWDQRMEPLKKHKREDLMLVLEKEAQRLENLKNPAAAGSRPRR